MIRGGVAGGVASGKRLVSEQRRAVGAEVLDADRAGHAVLREPDVKQAICRRWGRQVLGPDGQIDRATVARIVFDNRTEQTEDLAFLERLTHPRIARRLRARMAELQRDRGDCVAVLDAPLLLKAGWDQWCDTIVFVDAPRRLRLARARQRGWSDADFEARERAQEAVEQKRSRADWIIDNSSSQEHTRRQVQRFWRSLPR